ncbi:Hypothetical_protein [Hexamita inflata]|uniref:Hypothetical_protein n=1 Tax=Hexamita inflata TaxID=28002 RepID=A0AA86UZT9_9EUKA|nr:Hypothetical protein HINF_LOCUS62594 [Hexamita inflata]
MDFSEVNSLYGRLGTLEIDQKCVFNLEKLEGYWDCVSLPFCVFTNKIQINKFGANQLKIVQYIEDNSFEQLELFQNSAVNILDLQFRSPNDDMLTFNFDNPNIYSFAKIKILTLCDCEFDFSQISGSYQKLFICRCIVQGQAKFNLVVDKVEIYQSNITGEQLSSFSCMFLELSSRYEEHDPITDLPQQLQKLSIECIPLNITNSKQYCRLFEIILQECCIQSLSFTNIPNIKSITMNQCKHSKASRNLLNIINKKKKFNTIQINNSKEVLQVRIKNQELKRNCNNLKQNLEDLFYFDICYIRIGIE